MASIWGRYDMNADVAVQQVGDWNKQVGVSLQTAVDVSMAITGRNAFEACKHAIIVMAQSARALTKQSSITRKIGKDERGEYILDERGVALGREARKWYLWMFKQGNMLAGKDPKNFLKIRNRGLAKRSWMWGLADLPGNRQAGSTPMPGIASLQTIARPDAVGFILDNRLNYMDKAIPAGWEAVVETKAGNKIMAQARDKMMREWRQAVGAYKSAKLSNSDLAAWFKARAA